MKQNCINYTKNFVSDILAVHRGGTWFIAAVIGPIWWVIFLAMSVTTFPSAWKPFPCRLFFTGVRLKKKKSVLGASSLCGREKGPRFIRVGMFFICLAYCAA